MNLWKWLENVLLITSYPQHISRIPLLQSLLSYYFNSLTIKVEMTIRIGWSDDFAFGRILLRMFLRQKISCINFSENSFDLTENAVFRGSTL